MKRDMDLVRDLLLEIEGESEVDLSGYSEDQILYHKALILEAGLTRGAGPIYSSRGKPSEIPLKVSIYGLTWEGHDFLAQAREPAVWELAKSYAAEKGVGITIEAMKIAISVVVQKLLQG